MLIGRNRQLAELILAGSERRTGVVTWLQGTEGVGKSTLARAASAQSGRVVHHIDVYPEDRDHPLAAVRELGALLGVGLDEAEPSRSLLGALEAAGPCCILLEDAQWMDEASQQVLWQVVRRSRLLPVWMIVTSTAESGPLFDGLSLLLRSPDRGRLIRIPEFTEAETADFLRTELGFPVEGDALIRAHAITGGSPALLSSLVDQLRLAGRAVNVRTVLNTLTTRHRGSGLVRDHVATVMATASPTERASLIALAQSGDLSTAQLGKILEAQSLPDTGAASLTDSGLVERSGPQLVRLRYKGAAGEILDHATWTESRDSHAALAEVLGGLEALDHAVAAAGPAEAPAVLADLQVRLIDAYAQHDLTLAFRLAHLASRLDPSVTIEVVLAALRSGRPTRLLDIADDLADLPPSVLRTSVEALLDTEQLDVTSAVERLTRLDPAAIADPRELVILTQACVHLVMRSLLESTPPLRDAFRPLLVTLRDRSNDTTLPPWQAAELALNAVVLEALIVHAFDDRVPPAERIEPLLALADRAAADPRTAAVAPLVSSLAGILHYVVGDLSAAHEELKLTGPLFPPMLLLQTQLTQATLAFLHGDWDRAHTLADRQLGNALDALEVGTWQQAFAVASLVPAVRGEDDVVRTHLDWQASATVASVGEAQRNLTLAWQAIARGDQGDVVAALLDPVWHAGLISYTGSLTSGALRVSAHARAGNLDGAAAARSAILTEPYERRARDYALAHSDAMLAAAAGDATAAERLFTEAVDHLDAHEAAHPRATLRVYRIVLAEDWVRSTLAAGGTPSAAAIYLLAESTRLLAANGAGAWRDRLARLAAGLPATHSVPAARHRLESLTSREREVASLAASGLTNKEIASQLFVTVRTAEYHVHNAMTKLQVSSRARLHGVFAASGR
ncbi:helix-turn-helix transcriptional regulator [Tessaracoccus defluvii]|nr:LuxR C-terminal-related transcriptional regulator [Tessaracoccus defluvii]